MRKGLLKTYCGSQSHVSPPQPLDTQVLIPRTCDYVMFHGKGELRLLINLIEIETAAWVIQIGPG